MNDSRLANAKRNMLGALLAKVTGLLFPFITRTILIYYLGTTYLGLSSLFTSVLHILSLAELGFGEAMVFSMYKPMGDGDTREICALLNLYKRFYRYVGIFIATAGLVITPFIDYLINGSVPNGLNIYVLYLINLAGTVVSYYMYAYRQSLLTAGQRMDIISNIGTAANIVMCVLQITILILFKNFYMYCLIKPVMTIVQNLILGHITKKMYPNYICTGHITKDKYNDITKRVVGLFLFKICYVLRTSIHSIILSAYLGLDILGKYHNYYLIVTTLMGMTSIITNSVVSSIGNSIVIETEEKNYRDFNKFQFLYMWLVGWCTVCMICLYQPFINLWLGKGQLFSDMVMIVFAVYFFSVSMGNICYVYRQAAGLWWEDRIRPIVDGLLNLFLSLFLVKCIGVAGVLLATIICQFVIDAAWGSRILFKNYFIHEKQIKYLKRLGLYIVITSIACIFTGWLCCYIPQYCQRKLINLLYFCIRGLICVVIPNILFVIIYRRLPEYKESIILVRRILKK